MDNLKEDTVSADRKERIIFDADAWRKSDKSGRKTSAITSRQNFDNEKFTRKASKEEQVDEGTIQPSSDSKIDSAGPTQSDMISKDTKPKKSNNPQIEFVTGTVNPNGSSSTAIGNQAMTGRKLAETLIKKAVKQVSEGRMKDKVTNADFEPEATGSEKPPFDGPYTKSPDVVVDKSGARHTPMSRARDLARKAFAKKQVKEAAELAEAQYAGLEKEDKPGKMKTAVVKTHPKAVEVETVEGWKDEKKPVKEGWDPEQFGSDGSGAGRPGGAGAGDISTKDKKKKTTKLKETVMSKTYADFIQQLQEYNAGKDGVYRHKGTYGGSYDSNDDEDDDAPKKPAAPAVKRGRGRPAGSKSGANQKVTTGKSYGGIATHSLNLPNSNR
jgi:hypothetical protein